MKIDAARMSVIKVDFGDAGVRYFQQGKEPWNGLFKYECITDASLFYVTTDASSFSMSFTPLNVILGIDEELKDMDIVCWSPAFGKLLEGLEVQKAGDDNNETAVTVSDGPKAEPKRDTGTEGVAG